MYRKGRHLFQRNCAAHRKGLTVGERDAGETEHDHAPFPPVNPRAAGFARGIHRRVGAAVVAGVAAVALANAVIVAPVVTECGENPGIACPDTLGHPFRQILYRENASSVFRVSGSLFA